MKKDFQLDISDFSKELKWMLLLLQEDRSHEVIIQQMPENMDWKLFLELVQHHRVFPLVYTKLKKVDTDLVPGFVMQSLAADYKRNTFQMLHLAAEMERVTKALDEQGIKSLQLKGPVLSWELYGDLSMRTSKDLDILVPVEDVERAEGILVELGYSLRDQSPRDVLNMWKKKSHHVVYDHPVKRTCIEIHWKLNPQGGSEPSFDELWHSSRNCSFTNGSIRYLGAEDLFLYLSSHGARHGWFRLRWLEDINRLLIKGMEFKALASLLKKYSSTHLGGQAIILAQGLFKTPFHQDMNNIISSFKARRLAQRSLLFVKGGYSVSYKPTFDLSSTYWKYFMCLKSSKQKVDYFIHLLYPSPKDIETLLLPKTLHFLYYPLRPILWCVRKAKNKAIVEKGY